ncbi:response regulator transcription factor [Microlunatus sp. Gsoil 973]|uniref:response regulator n=1 Tax=Microlunatus sp. Gsoil 973 TaxID=2672569 RepID=UPI0012B4C166|nr:response regulator transcription factor [Microlunatus sp. Gsoil 973]QGN34828.1 response regulator [Microlunatus sp. Gsoil 973]
MAISVVVADDHALIRAGIVMLLAAQPDIIVAGEAANGAEVLELVDEHHPDVVLMDLRMPGLDGIETTRRLTADPINGQHGTKVLVLTTFADDESVYPALRAGAHGYLLKHAAPQDLATAIRRVAGGDAWLDPSITGGVIERLAHVPEQAPDAGELITVLTPREREVLALIAQGLSNRQISEELVVSEATVKTHVARVIMKTGCRDRAQVVALAYRSGLIRVS